MSFSIGGLGTGLDTNLIIQQLMEIERGPINLLQDQQSKIQADLSAWQTVESNLNTLQQSVDGLSDIFNQMTTIVNNPDIVNVTADSTATPSTYNLDVIQLAQAHTIASDPQIDSTSALGLSGTFQINGVDITVNTTDSLTDIQSIINNTSGTGVNATIIDNQLVLKSNLTGTANEITLIDDSGTNILQSLGLLDGTESIKNELLAPKDAQFTLDGLNITRSSNEITDVIEGVTLDLKNLGSTQFAVNKDIDGMIERIKDLVDAYNNTADKLNSLTENDGKLQGDLTLNQIKYKLRRNLTDPINTTSSINQLALIGITTDRYGKVSVNETELRDALTNNFSDVKALFFAQQSTDGYSGIIERLDNYLSIVLDTTGPVNGTQDMLQERIDDIDEQIESLEYRMDLREKTLRQQFIAMEKAVALMNNQMAWLQSQIASLYSSLTSSSASNK